MKKPTTCSRLATNWVRERATHHRGEECPWRGGPDLGGVFREKWLKKWDDMTMRPPSLFAWCIPKRERSRCDVAPVFPEKVCENDDLEPQRQL